MKWQEFFEAALSVIGKIVRAWTCEGCFLRLMTIIHAVYFLTQFRDEQKVLKYIYIYTVVTALWSHIVSRMKTGTVTFVNCLLPYLKTEGFHKSNS